MPIVGLPSSCPVQISYRGHEASLRLQADCDVSKLIRMRDHLQDSIRTDLWEESTIRVGQCRLT